MGWLGPSDEWAGAPWASTHTLLIKVALLWEPRARGQGSAQMWWGRASSWLEQNSFAVSRCVLRAGHCRPALGWAGQACVEGFQLANSAVCFAWWRGMKECCCFIQTYISWKDFQSSVIYLSTNYLLFNLFLLSFSFPIASLPPPIFFLCLPASHFSLFLPIHFFPCGVLFPCSICFIYIWNKICASQNQDSFWKIIWEIKL